MLIPKIIHQVWEGKDGPPPNFLLDVSQTWKEQHPDWMYIFWDGEKINSFMSAHPEYMKVYEAYRYAVQRWDMIRYLILYEYGGVYADLDYECIEPLDGLLENESCCLASDPEEHARIFNKSHIVTNAFMAVEAKHPLFKVILEHLLSDDPAQYDMNDKFNYVLETTGPYMLTRVYDNYDFKEKVRLLPASVISPLTKNEVALCIKGYMSDEELKRKLQDAVAIHYFYGSWYS